MTKKRTLLIHSQWWSRGLSYQSCP